MSSLSNRRSKGMAADIGWYSRFKSEGVVGQAVIGIEILGSGFVCCI